MADHDEVKNRFAQALKARQEESKAQASARYEAADRALEPILERIAAVKDGLDSLGNERHQIERGVPLISENGDMSVDIVMSRGGKARTITISAAEANDGRPRLYAAGLMPQAAKALGESTGAQVSNTMTLDQNTSHDVADAVEASALEYFGED